MAPNTWKPKPIEADHRQRVALAGIGDQFGQTGPLHALARHDVGEHLDRAGLLQTHGLSSHVLIAGADAGITQNIAHPVRLPNGRSVDDLKGDRFAHPYPSTYYVSLLMAVHRPR